MDLKPFYVRIIRSFFEVKYKAPGFAVFENPMKAFCWRFSFDIPCLCFVKGDISKNTKLFSKIIFLGLVRFVKSSLHIDIGFNGSACIFSTFVHLIIQLPCFTVHTNLLRASSNIH